MGTLGPTMIQLAALITLAGCSVASPVGYGHHLPYLHPKCKEEVETITKKFCRVEIERTCTMETIKLGVKITGYEKGECKEVTHCLPTHGYHGKREAVADPGYGHLGCEKVTQEICQQVPVTEEVSEDVEVCKGTPKEVCEDVEVKVPKIKCEEPAKE